MATTFSFALFQRTDTDFEVTLQDQDGNPLELARVSLTAKIRETDPDADAVIALDSHDAGGAPLTSQAVVTDPSGGKAIFRLSKEATDVPPGTYFYDVKCRVTAGTIHIPLKGSLTVEESVTDRDAEAAP
jgi:hypothetical protein